MRAAFALFLVAHGLVHLLYVGWSSRRFELRPGMAWPDESWALSRLLGKRMTRTAAAVVMVFATGVFIVAGVALMLQQPMWPATTLVGVASSTAGFILFWNGRRAHLLDQGALAVLINGAIALLVLVAQ